VSKLQADTGQLREEGNKCFKSGDYDAALSCYTQALNLSSEKKDQGVLHRNRAACYLKLEDYLKAELDASKAIALEMDSGDVKALFRRSQALEKLGRPDQAFLDVQRCTVLEPKNKLFQELLRKLGVQIQEKVRVQNSTDAKVEQMFEILLNPEEKDTEKQQKAAQNLIILAREDAGAERIFRNDGVRLLQRLLETRKSEMILAALRTLVGLCCGHQTRTAAILNMMGVEKLCAVMGSDSEQVSLAACNVLQVMFDSLREGMKKEVRGKEEAVVLDSSRELRSMVYHLLEMLAKPEILGPGRDSALNLLIKNVPRKSLRDPNNSLTLGVIDQGLKKILTVGGTVSEIPRSLSVTENTRMSTSVLLSKLYDDLKCDSERENFHKLCEEHVRELFEQGPDGKLQAIQTVSCLLQGPSDVGNRALELSGIMESVISLCSSEREIDQLVAVEALIHAAGKAKRASFITANGVTLLKDTYKKNENDKIRIRALVGLCKLGSAGGTDFSMKQFAEGSTLKLAKQCRKWICNEAIHSSTRRWAVEGLAYLTFDADVKEEFVEDAPAMEAMFELAKSEDKTVLFAVASTLVNCTNSYDKEELDPQMVELAKYAKQHIPEEHPKDKKKFVVKRIRKLLEAGVVSALSCMMKKESPALTDPCKELLSRVFLALVDKPEDRGMVVAQGGGKQFINLEGQWKKQCVSQHHTGKWAALTLGHRSYYRSHMYEVVRPLTSLLHVSCTALQNFEALMALTNLAGISERLRLKIIKEKALPNIENYMFEDHEMIRVAATECMCNMVLSQQVQDLFLAEGNDRLKLLVLYSGEEDEKLRRAASGTLAMLTSLQPKICSKIPKVTMHWLEILQALVLSSVQELQHRGVVVVMNMVNADREAAAQLMESEMLEILSVLAKEMGDVKLGPVAMAARECLTKAVEYGLIKPNMDQE
uniref:Unc-45 myosin chaperone A n=1 Tax=Latimeria chalumnae TaxID=7897 RepID=H3B8Z5_LATCH